MEEQQQAVERTRGTSSNHRLRAKRRAAKDEVQTMKPVQVRLIDYPPGFEITTSRRDRASRSTGKSSRSTTSWTRKRGPALHDPGHWNSRNRGARRSASPRGAGARVNFFGFSLPLRYNGGMTYGRQHQQAVFADEGGRSIQATAWDHDCRRQELEPGQGSR